MLYRILMIILWPFFKLYLLFHSVDKPKALPDGKLIICSNHKSWVDPFILALSFKKRINFLAKVELFKNKFLAWILKSLGAIPVDRQNIDLKAIKSSVNVLKEGKYLGIFPEGTRVKEVKKENIKNGISYIALKGDSDILPIEIVGEYKLFGKVRLEFKPIIKIDNYKLIDKKEAYTKIAEDVYKSIYNIT